MKEIFSNPEQTKIIPLFLWRKPLKCNINTHTKGTWESSLQTIWTCNKKHSNKHKCLKVLYNIFGAKLKTLDKSPRLGIVWNYVLEEAIKKIWETQMFRKRCYENLSKIHSEPCQTSKMDFFTKIVHGL